jgi:PAS domain S-box-containing protein
MSTATPADTFVTPQGDPRDYLAGIQTVASALAGSQSLEGISGIVVSQVLPVFGPSAGLLCLLNTDGLSLRTVRTTGFSPEQVGAWTHFPITAPVPVAAAVRERRPVVYRDREEYLADHPEFRAIENVPIGARVAVPLMLGERAIGGLGLAFEEPRSFSEVELQFFETIALLCAQAIDRARLHEAEQTARREATEQRDLLQSTYEHLRLTSQAVGLGTWEWDTRTNVVYWSETYRDIYGIPRDAIPAFKDGIAAVLEEDRPGVMAALGRCLHGGEDFVTEHRVLHPSAGLRCVRGLGRFLRGPDGERTKLVGVVWDETNKRLAVEALRDSEEKLRLAIEGAGLGTTHWDLVTNEVSWSDTMSQIYGRRPEEIRTVEDVIACVHPEDREKQALRAQAVRSGQPDEGLEYRVVWPDGTIRWAQSRGRVYLNEEGRAVRFEGVIQDITARKEAELAIERSRNDLQLITDAAPMLISYVDREQIFRFNNKHYERWFGETLGQVAGKHIRDVLGPDAYDGVKQYVERALGGEPVSFETFMPYTKTRPRYIRAEFVPDVASDGAVRGFVAVVSDITAATLNELEREKHLEEIAALNDRLQRAMTETHHRVKNNLQGIGALVEVQADDEDGSLGPDAVRRLIAQIQTLAKVHDILTHQARGDATADTISSAAIIEQLVTSLQTTAGGRAIVADAENFPVPIRQGTSLAIILNEVVTNSLKHGGQTVELRLFRRAGASGTVVMEVCDDGPGFPPDLAVGRAGHIGLELVERLCRWDLRGSVVYGVSETGGARVAIEFPLEPHAA